MSEQTIGTDIETIWDDFVPEPVDATAWSIEWVGPDEDDVRLYFVDQRTGRYCRVDLTGTTERGYTKSSEFADDLYDVTSYLPE